MNEKPEKNPHLRIVPKDPVDPEEMRRQMQQEAEQEWQPGFRITPYNIDEIVFEDDPQKNNIIKIEMLERMLSNEKSDSPEKEDIVKKIAELKELKF